MRAFLAGALLLVAAAIPRAGEAPPVRVVFSGMTSGSSWDVWHASADGARIQPAVQTPDVDERTPVLSPDRRYVAYSTSRGEMQLYDLYDRAARTLSLPGTGRPSWPAWDPTGRSLYCVEVQMGNGPDEGTIWRYDIEAGKAEKVADEPEVEGWPSVSDDGVLLFTTWTQSQSCHLSTMAPGAPQPKMVWDNSLTLSGAAQLPGGRIAAVAGDAIGQKVLLLRNGKLEREIIVPGASGRPTAYDNGALLLTRIEDGNAGIHVLNVTSGTTRKWLPTPPKDLMQMRDPDYR